VIASSFHYLSARAEKVKGEQGKTWHPNPEGAEVRMRKESWRSVPGGLVAADKVPHIFLKIPVLVNEGVRGNKHWSVSS